jgi:Family of unknown function (DUF6130)
MFNKKFVGLVLALSLFSVGALAADAPQLMISSPQEGQTVQPTPGLGPVAIVQFTTQGFKVEGLAKHGGMDHKMGKMMSAGHVHVTVDDNSWYWVHSDSDPVVIAGLKPGPHKVTLELVGADHMSMNPPVKQTVNFTMGGGEGMSGGK